MKFKKMLAVVSALCMMCAVVPVLPVQNTAVISASAEDTEYSEDIYENLTYKKYADYIEISGYVKQPEGKLIIPAEIDGLPVTSIGYESFSSCSGLTSVTIPESVIYIKENAFSSCSGLTSITISNGVISIGSSAFFGCSVLTSVTIPDSVTSIGDMAFYGCGLTSVTIPDSVTNIGGSAFSSCSGLTSVTIPDSVTSIGSEAFSETPWLKAKQAENPLVVVNHILIDGRTCKGNVIIPYSVTSIGIGAFEFCTSLTSVTIPDSVTSIGMDAFMACTNLTSVTIPDSVTSIEYGAFEFCTSLTSVSIPKSVTHIGTGAFSETPWLKAKQEENPLVVGGIVLIDGSNCKGEVVIPDGVTSIGNSAFDSCSSLTSVTIPDSVTSIGSGAFSFCSGLTSVTIENPDCEIYEVGYTISNGSDENWNSYFNGTIYGYENSTAQAYAEKYGYNFEVIGSAPETTEPTETETSAPVAPAEDMVWNGVNPDINRDGAVDAADSAVLLTYAAEFGAGKVSSFKEFMDKYYS